MNTIRIALDWTANTNHSGFFVALDTGIYNDHGLDVQLLSPADDGYATTPAKKVELGLADLAIAPMETVISYRTKLQPYDLVAVAALLQQDLSSIAVLAQSPVSKPGLLDGKTYASYKARYEDHIVRQMIRNDGGQGVLDVIYPEKLGIWSTLLEGNADATWIFDNWEGVWARRKGIALRTFRMADYGIPYGYSPVLVGSSERLHQHPEVYRRLLSATYEGYLLAAHAPEKAVAALLPRVPPADSDPAFLLESQVYTAPAYGTAANWGHMQHANVAAWLHWLYQHGLENTRLAPGVIATHSLLPGLAAGV